jgi:hypothetical protein
MRAVPALATTATETGMVAVTRDAANEAVDDDSDVGANGVRGQSDGAYDTALVVLLLSALASVFGIELDSIGTCVHLLLVYNVSVHYRVWPTLGTRRDVVVYITTQALIGAMYTLTYYRDTLAACTHALEWVRG